MNNRISHVETKDREFEGRSEPRPIGAVLAELLAQYQARFPEARISIVETPAAAV
jgi:hypothetical protein